MEDKTRRKYIDFAAKHRFKFGYAYLNAPPDMPLNSQEKEGLAECRNFISVMETIPFHEVEQLYYETLWGTDRFYEHPNAQADYSFWAKAALWTSEEAAALLLGKAPKYINSQSLRDRVPNSNLNKKFSEIQELLNRAFTTGEVEPIRYMVANGGRPAKIIEWAINNNLPCPKELLEALGRYADSPTSALPTAKRNEELWVAYKRLDDQYKTAHKKVSKRAICKELFHSPEFNSQFGSELTIERIISDKKRESLR